MKVDTKQKLMILSVLIILSQVLIFYWESNSVTFLIRICGIPSILSFILILETAFTYKNSSLLKKILLYMVLLIFAYMNLYFAKIFLTVELPVQ
jgi:hypothetical protein